MLTLMLMVLYGTARILDGWKKVDEMVLTASDFEAKSEENGGDTKTFTFENLEKGYVVSLAHSSID